MAPTTAVRLTPLALLLDITTRASVNRDLGTYLAVARIPGPDWKSYDTIARDLTTMSDKLIAGRLSKPLNRVSLKTFAREYGIPDQRYADGKSLPCPASDAEVDAYLAALDPTRVDLNQVRAEAAAAKGATGE